MQGISSRWRDVFDAFAVFRRLALDLFTVAMGNILFALPVAVAHLRLLRRTNAPVAGTAPAEEG